MDGKKTYCFFGAELDLNRPKGNWIDQVFGLHAVKFVFILIDVSAFTAILLDYCN